MTGTITCNKPVSTKGFCHRNAFVEQIKQFLECFFLHLIAALDHGRGQRKIFFPKHIQQLSCYIVCACDHRKQHGLSKGNTRSFSGHLTSSLWCNYSERQKYLSISLPYNLQVIPFWTALVLLGHICRRLKVFDRLSGMAAWVLGVIAAGCFKQLSIF